MTAAPFPEDDQLFGWLRSTKHLLTPKELAEGLRVTPKAVYRSDIPRVAVTRYRGTRYDPADVVMWLRQRRGGH